MPRDEKYPFPEALRPALKVDEKYVTWTVRAGFVGATDISKRRMSVPVGDDPTEDAARTHEMGHVKWSPAEPVLPEGLDPGIVLAVEDARINARLDAVGMQLGHLVPPEVTAAQWTMFMAQPTLPIRELVLRGVAQGSTAGYARYQDQYVLYNRALQEKGDPISIERSDLLQIASHLWGTATNAVTEPGPRGAKPDFQRTLTVARWLQEQLEGFERDMRKRLEAAKARAKAEAAAKDAATRTRLKAEAAAAHKGAHKDTWEKIREDAEAKLPNYSGNRAGGALPIWQPMQIKRPALCLPYPGHVYRRKQRSTDAGTVPRTMHRWAADKAVFGEKRKRGLGGTVLVDNSGSMGIRPDQLLRLLKLAPAAKVATYSGHDLRRDHGTLTIIADKGKRARDADIMFTHGGNGVDHPALQWLAKQPGPRYWVSDAGVTCVNGQYDLAKKQCFATLSAMAGIRIPSAATAIKTFEMMAKPGVTKRRA